MTRRLPAVIVVVAVGLAALLLFARGRGTVAAPGGPEAHRVDLVAVVESVSVDTGWSMDGGRTVKVARLSLDDTRILTLSEGTLVAAHGDVPVCTDLATPRACVLLADMLGQAVVRFALVPANTATPAATLELPGIVDMQANGDEGVLANGWVLRLATPTKRQCADTPTSNLRDFITRFPGAAARSTVDLVNDEIMRVECTRQSG